MKNDLQLTHATSLSLAFPTQHLQLQQLILDIDLDIPYTTPRVTTTNTLDIWTTSAVTGELNHGQAAPRVKVPLFRRDVGLAKLGTSTSLYSHLYGSSAMHLLPPTYTSPPHRTPRL